MLMRHRAGRRGGASTTALAEGRVPAREVLDGVLVIFGGALLLTPGFITDILGLLLPAAADARGRCGGCWCARFAHRMTWWA